MRTERFFKNSFPARLLPFYFFGLLLFALFNACEQKPGTAGGDILPSGDDFTVSFDSTEQVYGYTKIGDSIPSGFKQNYLIGSIRDQFFGSSRAEIVTTISSSTTSKGFGPNAEVDSLILYLKWEDWSGEGSSSESLHLYEFTEYIRADTVYYSDMDVTGRYREPELGSASFTKGDSLAKIYITNQEFIEKFRTAHDSILSTTVYLQKLMYGLYLTTDDADDEGGIARINFDQPGNFLIFYYYNDTAAAQSQYYSLVNENNGHLNLFRHDYSECLLGDYLGNGSKNDSLIFVQSMTGVNPVIHFPELSQWIQMMDSIPIAINEARLTFTMADTNNPKQQSKYFPEVLNLYIVKEDGRYFQTYDNILDPGSFGGEFDHDSLTYSYTIKVQLQSILAGDVPNLEMVLIPANLSETISRGVLYGWSGDYRKRIRLEITYTVL
ncbi:DUF4270 family protein [Bacteroidota bacterium]